MNNNFSTKEKGTQGAPISNKFQSKDNTKTNFFPTNIGIKKIIDETYEINKKFPHIQKSKPKTIKELLLQSRIDPFSTIEKPPTILSIDNISFGTLGNFSCVTGKSKSRKTFFLSILIAAAIDTKGKFQRIKTEIPNSTVLHFDTEQSNYHTQKVAKRITSLINNDILSKNSYKCFCLRPFSPKERTDIIQEAIYNTKNLKLVIIDGIADLIVGYNNEESAIEIIGQFMKWTHELNIHIITIIHQNKGDNNAKGHLGSLILQKAETVLSIEKDGEISTASTSHSRNKEINPLSFSVDEMELPFLVDYNSSKSSPKKQIRYPRDINDPKVHENILTETFDSSEELKSLDFKRFLKDTLAKHDINIGDNAIREWQTFYEKQNMIIKENQQSPFKLSPKIKVC